MLICLISNKNNYFIHKDRFTIKNVVNDFNSCCYFIAVGKVETVDNVQLHIL